MGDVVVQLPVLHSGQRRIVAERRRFNIVDAGRRFGKDVLGEDILINIALDGFPVAWFAPAYPQMLDVWREIRGILAPVISDKSEQEHRLQLVTGGTFEMWSLDSADTARGHGYKAVVINEAAGVAGLMNAWQMVIRATLADYEGEAWFLSTPRGLNAFWQLYMRGQDPLETTWKSWKIPTSANPYIKAEEIEEARKSLPSQVFAQEFLAEFIEDSTGVFRGIADAKGATRQDEAIPNHQYVIGCDWGKLNDFTVLTVMDVTTREVVYIDRFNQIDYAVQANRLEVLYGRFKPSLIIAELNAMGMPIVESLQRKQLPVFGWTATNATKARIIDDLALAFEQKQVKIVDDIILIGELQAYQAERLPSGLLRYTAPVGMHDDMVISLALAWQGALSGERHRPLVFREFAVVADT